MDNELKNPQTSKPNTDKIYNCIYMTFWKGQNPRDEDQISGCKEVEVGEELTRGSTGNSGGESCSASSLWWWSRNSAFCQNNGAVYQRMNFTVYTFKNNFKNA